MNGRCRCLRDHFLLVLRPLQIMIAGSGQYLGLLRAKPFYFQKSCRFACSPVIICSNSPITPQKVKSPLDLMRFGSEDDVNPWFDGLAELKRSKQQGYLKDIPVPHGNPHKAPIVALGFVSSSTTSMLFSRLYTVFSIFFFCSHQELIDFIRRWPDCEKCRVTECKRHNREWQLAGTEENCGLGSVQ